MPLTPIAIIGDPVNHSLSPAMHNAGFQFLSLPYFYLTSKIQPGLVSKAVEAARTLGYRGLNITMPLKYEAGKLPDILIKDRTLSSSSKSAERDVMINTLVFQNSEIWAYNTDVYGISETVIRYKMRIGRGALVLGTGATAESALISLSMSGVSPLFVCGRNMEKTKSFVETIKCGYKIEGLEAVESINSKVDWVDFIVNATPAGMKGNEDYTFPLRYIAFQGGPDLLDMVYLKEDLTPAVKAVIASGSKAVDGRYPLVFQGAESFRLWTGHDAPVSVMAEAAGIEMIEAD